MWFTKLAYRSRGVTSLVVILSLAFVTGVMITITQLRDNSQQYMSEAQATPCVPTLFSPADGVSVAYPPISLTWSSCAGRYYEVSVVSPTGTQTLYPTSNSSSVQSTGLTLGTTYTWRVRSCTPGILPQCLNPSAWSATRTFIYQTSYPTPHRQHRPVSPH